MTGKLILCATPIGNLGDMTPRCVQTLREADLIAAEDTRNSRKLLTHFDIHTPMTSYHEFNKYDKARELVDKMQQGAVVALITDAGTPGISDPGEVLTQMAVEAGIPVSTNPGAAAFLQALILSGFSTRRFVFEAFLPQEKKEQREVLDSLKEETRTMILYEAPHRLRKTLAELTEVFGEDRPAAICKELTKKHEMVLRLTLGEAVSRFREEEPRGEYVIVIRGKDPRQKKAEQQAVWQQLGIEEHMQRYLDEGLDKKTAMKKVAVDRGVSKRDIYAALNRKQQP